MDYLKTKDAADYLGVSVNMMYIIAKNERAFCYSAGNRLYFEKNSLDEYKKGKHSRQCHYKPYEGGVKDVAAYLDCSPQRIYYLLRKKGIPHRKHGKHHIFSFNEINIICKENPKFFDAKFLKYKG